MIKIIIIDDEMLVKLGLKSYLNDYTDELTVLQTFSSAVDALQYMQNHEVDIVLTDVEMPDMSGIEYIDEIRKRKIGVGIIVISCHDSFEYARDALQLGADKYLLKHEINEDGLVREIRDLYHKKIHINYPSKIKADGETLIAAIEHIVELSDDKKYAIGILELYQPYLKDYKQHRFGGNYDMLFQILKELMEKSKLGIAIPNKEERCVLFFEFDRNSTNDEFISSMRNLYNSLDKNLVNYTNFHCSLGVSGFAHDLEGIKEAFNIAKKRLALQFYKSIGSVFYEGYEDDELGRVPTFSPSVNTFQSDNWLQMVSIEMDSFMNGCREAFIPPDKVKDVLNKRIHFLIERVLEFFALQNDNQDLFIPFADIEQFQNSTVLCSWLIEKLGVIRDDILNIILSSDQIHAILSFLSENYAQPLSLEKVAMKFHMSTNYFCKLFKQKTNTNFVTYLNTIRLEKAEQLFKQRKYNAAQVAEMTGFNNVNYLSRVLKKMRGTTISELKSGSTRAD
jgi:YesN/AraC family two-component response regulator